MEKFKAQVKLDGVNPYVDTPENLHASWDEYGNIPVLIRLKIADGSDEDGTSTWEEVKLREGGRLQAIGRLTEDGWFRTTIVTRRSDAPRLYLDKWMRESSGAAVDDFVEVIVRHDPNPREIEIPNALMIALEADPEAMALWDALAPSRRREILSYLHFLKTRAALERNVEKTIASLKTSV